MANTAKPSQERLLSKETLGSLFRLVFGRRLRTAEARDEQVSALQGVPILGLDALGSASYGPEAALTILAPLGVAGLLYAREVIGAILLLLAILFFSYRQTIAAYPSGGGSYTVAKENLGRTAGLIAASSLLLDYVLNVAVGISAGVGALESAFPSLQRHTLAVCLVVLAIITFANVRGIRDVGLAWTIPTYVFVLSLSSVVLLGIWESLRTGGHPVPVITPPALPAVGAPVKLWLHMRAFASGCTAMTGVEAVSNGIPVFQEPKVMVMHWRRLEKGLTSPSLVINAIGACTTGVALIVIIIAKFTAGAWITLILIATIMLTFSSIRRHYAHVKREIRPPLEIQTWKMRALKVIVPIEGWNRVSEQALRFALRISGDVTAVHVSDAESEDELLQIWRTRVTEPAVAAGFPEPRLDIIRSPYRTFYQPLLDYIKTLRAEHPDRLIAVVVPELVQPRWWEYLLHNHVATALKVMLLLNGGEHIVIISTPWFLHDENA